MGTIKAHLGEILLVTGELSADHLTEPDEFAAINEIEQAVHKARKVFERTKRIDDEKSSGL